MAEKKLSVVITGDAKGARKAMGEVGSGADGMHSKLQSVGAGVGKVFKAAAVGATVLGVGVASFLKGGVDSLVNLEKLSAQTNAVIKSTGGAAGVTADQVSKYADSLEKATGVEAEGIIQGQNMLLTFTNLKNGVGEGNDIFNQATDIMTDMSVAMGTDASKTAVQLGKALNDPIKGISALSKVGVTFTDQQKAQIKAMVEAKKVTWDVVELESPDVGRGCDEGLFEKLDYARIAPKADFLPADLDEAWIVAHREHLRRLYLAQVRALAEQCLEQGTTGTAEPHLERALTLAPSDERHYALLIRLQLAAGCPGLASHTRQRAREALAHRGWTAAGTASEMP